jgi:AcrR family transcriptional regulator
VTGGWRREDRPELAVERILEAAGKAFIELGVPAAGMGEIARFAGCSRGTLYRYFQTRHALHLAYVRRAALSIQQRVQEAVAGIEDPEKRVVEYALRAIGEVRDDPATAAWFAPGASAMVTRMSRSAEVVEMLTSTVAAELPEATQDGAELRLRHRWIVRVIVSLLSDPGESEQEERTFIERFVMPVVVGRRGADAETATAGHEAGPGPGPSGDS